MDEILRIFTGRTEPPEPQMQHIGPQRCDRCGDGVGNAMTHKDYLVYLATDAVGALCPACATDDDPHHNPGSWLLSWN